jgi:hypothetical protein
MRTNIYFLFYQKNLHVKFFLASLTVGASLLSLTFFYLIQICIGGGWVVLADTIGSGPGASVAGRF